MAGISSVTQKIEKWRELAMVACFVAHFEGWHEVQFNYT